MTPLGVMCHVQRSDSTGLGTSMNAHSYSGVMLPGTNSAHKVTCLCSPGIAAIIPLP